MKLFLIQNGQRIGHFQMNKNVKVRLFKNLNVIFSRCIQIQGENFTICEFLNGIYWYRSFIVPSHTHAILEKSC